MPDTAIIDIDGTLVDTNYHHALAWYRAFARYGAPPELWRIHRHIGMGGDQIVPALVGEELEEEHGDDLRDAWVEEFDPFLPEIRAFEGAEDLLRELTRRRFTVVLASSGKPQHVEHFMGLFNGTEHCDSWTTSEDVENTKPAPDLMQVALHKAGSSTGVAIGDSSWDFAAAKKLDLATIGLKTGGFSPEELTAAGADQVYESLSSLLADLDATPLRAPR